MKLSPPLMAGVFAGVAVSVGLLFWRASGPPLRVTAVPGSIQPAIEGHREALQDQDLILQGRYLFERNCAVCHGRWGDGRGEMAEGMRPKPRNLASGIFKFRSTPSGFLPTDDDLERTIRGGIPNSSMPTFAQLNTREVLSVVAYVKTLSSRWQHSENYGRPIALPSAPDWLYEPNALPIHEAAGGRLFEANCAPCHGPQADGQSAVAMTQEDRWGDPCPPPNLRAGVWKSGSEPRDLFRVLTTGLDGTPMPSFQETLSDGDRWDLVAYLRSLKP